MFEDIARAASLVAGGVVAGMVARQFFEAISGRHRRDYAKFAKLRDLAMAELEMRSDISESDKAQTEASIARTYARQLEALDERVARTNKILLYFGAIGGTLGILALAYQYLDQMSKLLHLGASGFLNTSAFAAGEGVKGEIAPLLPYIATAVLALMGVSFFAAVGTLLLLKDVKENQARIRAADGIVKTFGGFFTGLATTLLK